MKYLKVSNFALLHFQAKGEGEPNWSCCTGSHLKINQEIKCFH